MLPNDLVADNAMFLTIVLIAVAAWISVLVVAVAVCSVGARSDEAAELAHIQLGVARQAHAGPTAIYGS
jgi:hypothetical protein